MNNKIQEAIDLIKSMFTKRLGEIGVYAVADLVLNFIAALPMAILGGISILSIGSGGGFSLNSLRMFTPDMSSGFDISMVWQLLGVMLPFIIGGLITLLLILLVVQPILTVVRLTFITSTADNLNENINLALKNVSSKIVRMILLFVYLAVIYIVIAIVVFIIMLICGLLIKVIGFVGVAILWIVLIAVAVALVYFLTPVIAFAPIDAMLTDKPIMSCIMDAFNAKAFRLPLILVLIIFGVVSGIVSAIFGWIPFVGLIVASVITFCQTCVVLPYYKEYAGK